MNYLNQTKIVIYNTNSGTAYIGDRLKKDTSSDIYTENTYSLADSSASSSDNGFLGGNGTIGVSTTNKINNVDVPDSRTFDPNNSASRFFIGTNVWDDNNWDNSIKANVDSQDEMLSDDLDTSNFSMSNLGKTTANSAKNLVTNKIGVVKDIKKIVNKFSGGEANPEVPDGTVYDTKFSYLKALKSEKYRNVKINSVVGGTYNSLANLLGFASGMMVGSLGKSSLSNELDGLTSKFTGGLGIAGMLENVSGALEAMPTVEEIAALNLVRFNTMYEARPGRLVRDRFKRYNFITPNTKDGIDGTVDSSSQDTPLNKVLGKINGVASKVTNAMNTASSWINGSKFTEFIASKNLNGNSQTGGDNLGTIISVQRSNNFQQYVGSIGSVDGNKINATGSNSKQSVRVGLNITDWTGTKYGGKYGILGTNPVITDLNGNVADVGKEGQSGWTRDYIFSRISEDYRKIGCLYIEPYYNGGDIECFQIPFEFNPTINDGGYEAKYQTQELLGRILSVRSYIGTDSSTVTLETTYMVLHDDDFYVVDGSTNWMHDWTTEQIEKIEQLYRSLVMPYINASYGTFVRPPIIRIKLRGYSSSGEISRIDTKDESEVNPNDNVEYVGDLFKYPKSTLTNNNILYVTKNLENNNTREKRYVATNLQISPLEDDSLSYQYHYKQNGEYSRVWRRYGFKVNLTLAETTRNFLDQPPSFKQYYDAYDETYKYNNENNYAYQGSEETVPDLGDFSLNAQIVNLEETTHNRFTKDYFDKDIEFSTESSENNTTSSNDDGDVTEELLAAFYKYGKDWQGEEQATT